MRMKKTVFIELTRAHSECIYSQLLYLKTAGYHVELICNAAHLHNVVEIKKIADQTMFISVRRPYVDTICNYIASRQFDNVIIGSAFYNRDHRVVRKLAAVCSADIFGVLHDMSKVSPEELEKPDIRQYTEKVNRFFVLADYIAANAPKQAGLEFEVIPLMFQPDYPPVNIDKPDGDIWIAIPGAVNFKRRDYMALLPMNGEEYAANVKFIMLGWDYGRKTAGFRDELRRRGIEKHFVFFDKFVDVAAFQSWIKKCDYVMPLIHERCDAFRDYLSMKITGNLNVALTYRKPMLCDEAFRAIPEYAAHSIFYERGRLCRVVNGLGVPDTERFYDAEFERSHSLEVLAARYDAFLSRK